jgi:hypothetical protein
MVHFREAKILLPFGNANGQIDLKTRKAKKFNSFIHHPEKENSTCHVRLDRHHQQQKTYTVIPQTFTTTKIKAEPTQQRSKIGGKTIAAIHHLPANTVLTQPARMSSEELKLLSRRIDPHEPLSSPHASPTKPPLPNLKRSRKLFLEDSDDDENTSPIKKSLQQYKCQPCNKVYKSKNGYSYHQDKCAHRHPKRIREAIINCICLLDQDDTETMIECVQCHTWLHLKCAGSVTREESYCCPRCLPPKKSETIAAVPPAVADDEDDEEENYNFTSLFSDDLTLDQLPPSTIIASDDFNNEWCNQQDDELPSLFFSSDNWPSNSSLIDDLPPSSPPSMDWFHFANFEQDFTFE